MTVFYPRWVDKDPAFLLREVHRGLYVGAPSSIICEPWSAVLDLCGSSSGLLEGSYSPFPSLLRLPLEPGAPISAEAIELCLAFVSCHFSPSERVLVQSRTGTTRSVAVAYAALRMLRGLSHDKAWDRVVFRDSKPDVVTMDSVRVWIYEEGGLQARLDTEIHHIYKRTVAKGEPFRRG